MRPLSLRWPPSWATSCPSSGGTATSATPRSWRRRTRRSATCIGDVDPVKVAQGRTLGDPETVHYGLVPRTNRGVFGLNELPDLAERIQVALVQRLGGARHPGTRLLAPACLWMSFCIATANPEDYTNRGRIITPLKDRFGAELRTHYLAEVADEVKLIRQEATLTAEVGDHLLEILARLVRNLRESSSVDQRSGRFSPLRDRRRGGRRGFGAAAERPVPVIMKQPWHGPAILPWYCQLCSGKIEFEMGEEGRERAGAGAPAAARHRGDVPRPAIWPGPVRLHGGLRPGRRRGDR